jgi:hypothetical protein
MNGNKHSGKEACVLFSGGSDSSLTAYRTALEFDRVHLLTYKQFGQIDIENSRKSFAILDKKMPNKFKHTIINVDEMFLKLYNHNYLKKLLKYKTMLMQFTCFACQACFHINTIIYCRKNNISDVRDGANTEYEEASPMQIAVVKEEIKKLYLEYGIRHLSPVYDEYKTKRSDFQLYELGLRPQPNIKDDLKMYKAFQGYCRFMPGSVLFLNYWKRCKGFPQKVQQSMLKHWKEEVSFMKEIIESEIKV